MTDSTTPPTALPPNPPGDGRPCQTVTALRVHSLLDRIRAHARPPSESGPGEPDSLLRWRIDCPSEFADLSLDTADEVDRPFAEDTLRTLRRWAAAPAGVLVLSGEVGTGKSALACSVALEAARRGTRVVYTREPAMLAALTPDPSDLPFFSRAGLLVLDELGETKTSLSEWRQVLLERVIDDRYLMQLPTVITTNLDARSPEEKGDGSFRTFVGERVFDRLRPVATLVVLPGPSRRRSKVAARAS